VSVEYKKDVDKVVKALQDHCVGETNGTYERYVFNQRLQDTGEAFDAFFADLRHHANTVNYKIRSCAIVLFAVCVMNLRDANCWAHVSSSYRRPSTSVKPTDESAPQQLRVMSKAPTEQVQAARTDDLGGRRCERSQSRFRKRHPSKPRDDLPAPRSSNCGNHHDDTKRCPASGQACRKCHKVGHYAKVCRSAVKKLAVNQLDYDDELDEEVLSLRSSGKRAYCRLNVCGNTVRFLLDSGATTNVLPLRMTEQSNINDTNTSREIIIADVRQQLSKDHGYDHTDCRTKHAEELNFTLPQRTTNHLSTGKPAWRSN